MAYFSLQVTTIVAAFGSLRRNNHGYQGQYNFSEKIHFLFVVSEFLKGMLGKITPYIGIAEITPP
jgi:hypothetical protein